MVEELTKDEIKKLRRTVRKFLDDKSKSDKEKVEILFLLVAVVGLFWTGIVSFE
ncbi:hypothetical protein [Methanobrevibacter sp. V74]|uniref:hypothetical protein n=1 Tax=Methanobrevibacter sp. V74 TaxID=3064279 RepID=UPI002736FBEC|nr:hypothetical protein [Methanobrevibacter sp. V74]